MSERPQTITPEKIQPRENLFKNGLSLPLTQDCPGYIIDGWYYDNNTKIHQVSHHDAVDFKMPVGTSILASADGFALSSSQFRYIKPKDRSNPDRRIGLSLGHVVYVWHPQLKLFTVYGHLQSINSDIPYVNPLPRDPGTAGYDLDKIFNGQDMQKFLEHAVPVKTGDEIGKSGLSGLAEISTTNDKQEQPLQSSKPNQEIKYWNSNPHLHFAVLGFDKNDQLIPIDPFGLESTDLKAYNETLQSLRQEAA